MDPTTSAGVGKRGGNAEGGKEEEEEGRENGDWFCHGGGQDLAEMLVERVLERELVLWAGPTGFMGRCLGATVIVTSTPAFCRPKS